MNADWREETVARVRTLIEEAVPDAVEEAKWRKASNPDGVPVWSARRDHLHLRDVQGQGEAHLRQGSLAPRLSRSLQCEPRRRSEARHRPARGRRARRDGVQRPCPVRRRAELAVAGRGRGRPPARNSPQSRHTHVWIRHTGRLTVDPTGRRLGVAPLKLKGDRAEIEVAARPHPPRLPDRHPLWRGLELRPDLRRPGSEKLEAGAGEACDPRGEVIPVRCRSASLTNGRVRTSQAVHGEDDRLDRRLLPDTDRCYTSAVELGQGRKEPAPPFGPR